MENRRPPRNYSPRQRPFSDRSRQPVSNNRFEQDHRGDGANSQQNRPNRRPGNGGYQPRAQSSGYGRQNRDDRYSRDGYGPARRPGKYGQNQSPNQRRGKPAAPKPEPPKIKITSDLQVTDGKYHGKLLQNSVSPKAEVTSRKLREIIFKVVSRRVRAGRFLDLGAGAGTVGIEAISRGAMVGTFVDRSLKMCSFARKNLQALGIKNGHGEVVELEILPFLKQMAARKRCWDLVYFGTRDDSSVDEAFEYLGRGTPVAVGGLLLIEHSSEKEYPETFGSLKRWRTIKHNGSTVTFYQRK